MKFVLSSEEIMQAVTDYVMDNHLAGDCYHISVALGEDEEGNWVAEVESEEICCEDCCSQN